MIEYNFMDEQLRSNCSKVFVLVVRRVTKMIHLFLVRMLIKINMVPIRTVDLPRTTPKLAEVKKWNKKKENKTLIKHIQPKSRKERIRKRRNRKYITKW